MAIFPKIHPTKPGYIYYPNKNKGSKATIFSNIEIAGNTLRTKHSAVRKISRSSTAILQLNKSASEMCTMQNLNRSK